MDWRKKSEEVRRERMRRVEEWERSHSGKKKGETKKKIIVSFNQSVSEDKTNSSIRVVASKTGDMKMISKDEYIGNNLVKFHQMDRSKTESSLQSLNSVQFTNSLDRKYASIDVLYIV
jgi:hypothetical protein